MSTGREGERPAPRLGAGVDLFLNSLRVQINRPQFRNAASRRVEPQPGFHDIKICLYLVAITLLCYSRLIDERGFGASLDSTGVAMWTGFGRTGLVLLLSVGAPAASAQSFTDFYEHLAGCGSAEQSLMSGPITTAFKTTQAIGDEIDPILREEDCTRIFPGTHYDPETEKCKSDWDGDYQNPEGSLFDIWPLGFDRDPGMPAYDGHPTGKKYLLIHHENPGWDPDHDIEIWEIVHFGENGFMERRLFAQPTISWDDPSGHITGSGKMGNGRMAGRV